MRRATGPKIMFSYVYKLYSEFLGYQFAFSARKFTVSFSRLPSVTAATEKKNVSI